MNMKPSGIALSILLLASGLLLSAVSCVKNPEYDIEGGLAPTISEIKARYSADEIGITLSATVSNMKVVKSSGFRWGESAKDLDNDLDAKIEDNTITARLETKDFGKRIYYQPYVTNGRDEVVGSTTYFTVPSFDYYVIVPDPSITFTENDEVKVAVEFEVAKGITLTEKGIRYGDSENSLTNEIKCGSGSGPITDVPIPGLELGKTYCFCAYAKEGDNESVSKVLTTELTKVTGVTLDKNTLALGVGESATLTATVFPSNATNKSVTWDSDNSSVASVSQSGVVSAKALGNATIRVTTVDGSYAAECSVFVDRYTDLSKRETANCYIVSRAGDFKFRGTVKGNSTESVASPSSAEVLWESFGTSTTPSVGSIITDVKYEDGYVKFSTPSTIANGNAVIAVKDASNNILWSWHIWVCKGFDPQSVAQVYNNNAGTMMDRNLGATSATPGDVQALGLLYQWGRKDPFLGGCQISYSSDYGQQIAASTISWPSAVSSTSSNGTISYSVAHPTTFITYNSNNYDWYYSSSEVTDNTRWQSTKTMYDPCPAGWRVPDGGESGVWSKAFGTRSSWTVSSNWDSTNNGMDFGSTDIKLGIGTIWYPAVGCRGHDSGSLYGIGYNGNYWSCTPNYRDAYQLVFIHHGIIFPSWSTIYSRAFGFPVRCLSE